MYDRTCGKERLMRLSQYMGDFQPLAHVNGFSVLSLMAPISSNFEATGPAVEGMIVICIGLAIYQELTATQALGRFEKDVN
jgi:hypothetical protein